MAEDVPPSLASPNNITEMDSLLGGFYSEIVFKHVFYFMVTLCINLPVVMTNTVTVYQ